MIVDFLYDNFWNIPLVILVLCVIACLVIFRKRQTRTFSSAARVKAKDIKRPVESRRMRGFVNTGLSGCCPLECFITFILQNGKEIELQCTSEIYKLINEGDEGILTYDRYYFISFEKNTD